MKRNEYRATSNRSTVKRFILSALPVLIWLPFGGNLSFAQIQIGTVKVTVTDPAADVVAGAAATLSNRLTGYTQSVTSDERGVAIFNNVPFDDYQLEIAEPRFQQVTRRINVRSNLPVEVEIRLSIPGSRESVNVEAETGLIERDSTSSELDLNERSIRRSPGAMRSVQQVLATLPGWTTENNGLMHIRGVDDGVLFVLDGVPVADRLDSTTASGLDTEMISSMNVLIGNLPAEFGGKSGAVVTIQPRSGIGRPLTGDLEFSGGSFNAKELSGSIAGGRQSWGFFVASSATHSDRYLDPVDFRNFNNRGGAARLNARTDWHPTPDDILIFNVSVNGSDLQVPNRLDQELAGQRQRQELRDNSESVSWQRTWSPKTVSNIAVFHRFHEARLLGSAFDTPLFAAQDRRHARLGLLASVTRTYRGHTFKAGVEATRVTPDEFFTFAVTDSLAAAAEGISDEALAFGQQRPFVFRDRKTRGQASAFLQDQFAPFQNLTINAGLRYDHSSLLASEQQFSPRVGAVYFIPKTRTAIRASFNRLFMPPQIENLLLADSAQARALSPFEGATGGGARVRSERTSSYEAGFAQDLHTWLKLDAVYWWRNFRNYDDPNVFFSTAIIFPNSVAKGFARGVDVRLDVPERRGWSGFLSYSNQRILQTGPINGGLFLTNDFIEIGPGTRFIPDHDERNVGALSVMYRHQRSGLWAALSGRHQSGVPLEVDADRLDELKSAPGADLVNFDRGRVRPWTLMGVSTGAELFRKERVGVSVQFDVLNLADKRFAYNFGNPFEGTHFGSPRQWSARLRLSFR
jgi:TonB dependent receptor/Carboxypeptidase regulatory-like domain/TonB-dependent Receptor Plug Domain